jgi:nucleoside-triphosphatase THEP1
MTAVSSPRVLITGSPGSGKSTLVANLIAEIQPRHVAGLITPEIRRAGVREGFKIIDLATGEEDVLAGTSGTGPALGKYRVNVEAIDRMVVRIESSLDAADFIFIDEVGRMELFSKEFQDFVEHVFSLHKPVVAVIHRSLVPRYQKKGNLFTVNRRNFEEVRQAILTIIKSEAS